VCRRYVERLAVLLQRAASFAEVSGVRVECYLSTCGVAHGCERQLIQHVACRPLLAFPMYGLSLVMTLQQRRDTTDVADAAAATAAGG
jgi:hypothetical protein